MRTRLAEFTVEAAALARSNGRKRSFGGNGVASARPREEGLAVDQAEDAVDVAREDGVASVSVDSPTTAAGAAAAATEPELVGAEGVDAVKDSTTPRDPEDELREKDVGLGVGGAGAGKGGGGVEGASSREGEGEIGAAGISVAVVGGGESQEGRRIGSGEAGIAVVVAEDADVKEESHPALAVDCCEASSLGGEKVATAGEGEGEEEGSLQRQALPGASFSIDGDGGLDGVRVCEIEGNGGEPLKESLAEPEPPAIDGEEGDAAGVDGVLSAGGHARKDIRDIVGTGTDVVGREEEEGAEGRCSRADEDSSISALSFIASGASGLGDDGVDDAAAGMST